MAGDEDLAAALPIAPPASPARRDAAIELALRRFDAQAGSEREPASPPRPTRRLSRPLVGGLAAAGLVALIGIPSALTLIDRRQPESSAISRYAAADEATPNAPSGGSFDVADEPPPPAAEPPTPSQARHPVATAEATNPHAAAKASPPPPAAVALAAPPPPAPPPASEPPAGAAGAAPQAMVAAAAPAPPRALAAAPAIASRSGESDLADVIVTARRVQRIPRGDWNACTLLDPARSLSGCRPVINPAARGAKGRAAAQVADGLAVAWNGDPDTAIERFDAALALEPKLALAWLNRGLAYRSQGDLDRAVADLDQAVRYAPNAARAYYNRSLALEERGDEKRAQADREHAATLDPAYAEVVRGRR